MSLPNPATPALLYTCLIFSEDLKAMFGDPLKLKETVDLLKETDLLVFDDIGAENLNPWLRDHVMAVILNYRMNRKPTFFYVELRFGGSGAAFQLHVQGRRGRIQGQTDYGPHSAFCGRDSGRGTQSARSRVGWLASEKGLCHGLNTIVQAPQRACSNPGRPRDWWFLVVTVPVTKRFAWRFSSFHKTIGVYWKILQTILAVDFLVCTMYIFSQPYILL